MITEGFKIPMDVSTLRTIQYVTNDLNKQETIKLRIKESIIAFESDNNQNNSKSTGNLDTNTTGISQSLLSIQDGIDELKDMIKNHNNSDLDIITSQVAKYAHPQISSETAIMQEVLPKMLENPELFTQFIELSKHLPGSTSLD